MAIFKLNVLHLHLNEGRFRVESKVFPLLNQPQNCSPHLTRHQLASGQESLLCQTSGEYEVLSTEPNQKKGSQKIKTGVAAAVVSWPLYFHDPCQ